MPHEKGEMGNLENASLEFDLDMHHEKSKMGHFKNSVNGEP
jgi:hypothetical protein